MTIKPLNEDSLAILLICSNLAVGSDYYERIKPYSLNEWNRLATLLIKSDLKTPRALFHTESSVWKSQLKLSDSEVERLKWLLSNGGNLSIELNNLNNFGIWVTTRAEETYPVLLKNRLKQKCPIFIYCAGDGELFNRSGIAVVGSRNIDKDGISFTQLLAKKAALEDYTIISGGARGVDSICENSAISANGKVISVVADSLEVKIRNKDVREAIARKQLLLISPFHPKNTFKVYNAMQRNKYIYALSQYAVAVSSDYNKGGTWAGAKENLYSKWVPLFVRNEDDIPKGNLELLKAGALPLKRDVVESDKVLLGDWLKDTLEAKQSQCNETSLFDMLSTGADETEVSAVEKASKSCEILLNEKNECFKKAYEIMLPHLLKFMTKPRTIEALVDIFCVRRVQMQDWIDKLLESEIIIKIPRPVRYVRRDI